MFKTLWADRQAAALGHAHDLKAQCLKIIGQIRKITDRILNTENDTLIQTYEIA